MFKFDKMEDAEHKIFINDVNAFNFQEHTYCQVQGESTQNGCKVQNICIGVQTVGEDGLLTGNPENNSFMSDWSNLNTTSQSAAMDNYAGKIMGTESNTSDKNIFQNIGDFCPDNEEGDCDGDLQNITLNWPPIVHRRKSHKSYLATWSAQISCDGFAKCLIETCNFISLDLQTMQDHYKTCNGIPNYDFNSCGSCSSWLPTGNELAMHESSCKGKKRDSSVTLPTSKDLNEAETNQSEIRDDNHISCASPPRKICRSSSAENNGVMESEERQMKYCDECDIEFLSDIEFSQHLICKKTLPETLPVTEKNKEVTGPVTDTSQGNDTDENNPIVQPGRPIFQGEYVRRRSFTKQHKIVWEAAIKKHKYVKCLFQNCHFLGLSVEDMIYHYGYCNGDGTFAKFVCHFCGGRLTRKNLLEIHVQRSHANERIDENKLLSTDIQNENSRQPPASDNNESSGSDPICFREFDPDFPLEAPLEVEITEESIPFDWQDQSLLGESINEEVVKMSDDLRQNKKFSRHSKSQKWGIPFGGSRHSTGGNKSRDSVAGVLNSLEEDNFEHSMVNTSQANARKNQQPLENFSERDYRDDHIYSKVKIRTVSETESRDSLSVRKKKNQKHYPIKKRVKGESLRVKGEETVPEKKSDCGKEIQEESQLNKSVSVSDASGKDAKKMSATPIPASQSTLKRDVLPHYTSIWTKSLETNGFARCLVATCNFISLDLLHVQNHFKNCNGIPEKSPNLCTFCESRLPSSVELEIHKSRCKASGEANSSSSSISQSLGECKKDDSVSKNRTGESSNAGEMEKRQELSENENKTREVSDSFKSNKDAAGGEMGLRKENTTLLRIGEIMKLKNKEIVDYNRIIQPGPVLPEGHYLRRRSYSKTHKAAWEAALEKHKYVKCLFQNCHFVAMCLEDMIYHFGYCIGDGSFAKFECPHCGGRLTNKVVRDIHIQRSHSDKLSDENDETSNEEGTEVLLCTLDDWKKLMAKKKLRTYTKNSPQLSIVVVEAEKAVATKNPLGQTRDKSSSSDAPPLPERKCRTPTSSEEVGESSDINNSISDFKNNACGSSADNQTHTNNDNNISSGSKTSPARNQHLELRSDEGGDEETQENTDNATKSVPAGGKRKTEDLVEMPGKGDIVQDTSDSEGRQESPSKSSKNSKTISGKRTPTTSQKPIHKQKPAHENPKIPEKPIEEQKFSTGNPGSPEKLIERKSTKETPDHSQKAVDQRERSQENPKIPEKSVDERIYAPTSSKENRGTPEKSVDEQKSSKGNPGTPDKLVGERKSTKGHPGPFQKPVDKRKSTKENPGLSEKPIDQRRRSQENPKIPQKPIPEQKSSKRNPGTPEKTFHEQKSTKGNRSLSEKPIDQRRRSQENPKIPEKPIPKQNSSKGNPDNPEKPIEVKNSSKGNPGTPEKPVDERKSTKENPGHSKKPIDQPRRSQENPKIPEKPTEEQKFNKGNPGTAEKSIDQRRRSHENPKIPEKPTDERKSTKENPGPSEKPVYGRKSTKENPDLSQKSVDQRRRSQENPKIPEKPTEEQKFNKGNPGTAKKSIDQRRRSQENPKIPEKPIEGQKSSKENPGTAEKSIDQRRRSHENPKIPEKPTDERKSTKENPGPSENPVYERKSTKENPDLSQKSVDQRRRSQENPKIPEKPIEGQKSSKENPGPSEKPVDQGRCSQENPKIPEKPTQEQKFNKGNPGTAEKSIDQRRRSQENPKIPEKPIEGQKSSKGNPGTAEKSIDQRRRSHENPKIPEKPIEGQKSSKGNPGTAEKSIDQRRRSHENPKIPEKPIEGQKSTKENPGPSEKPVDQGRCSQENPKIPEKPTDERKSTKENPGHSKKPIDQPRRSQENPKIPEKPTEEQKFNKGNPGTAEKSIDQRRRSQENPKIPEKPIEGQKSSKENPGTAEKSIDQRRRSHENPKIPEKPIEGQKSTKENPGPSENPVYERKSTKENPDLSQKSVDQRRRSQENPKIPEKPTQEQKFNKGNPGTAEKSIDQRRRSHENPKIPEKPTDERKSTKENPGPSENPVYERKSTKENPDLSQKSVDQRRRSQENPMIPEKPIEGQKSSKGNTGTAEKSIDQRRRSHENPKIPEKPTQEQKFNKGNPGTAEKSIDQRRRSQENPKIPEKPIEGQKSSKGNTGTAEKSIDQRRRSHENPKIPEKPTDERKSTKENPGLSEKPVDQGRCSQENPKIPEKPTEEQKSSKGNPGTLEKSIEQRRRSHENPKIPEKSVDEQKSTKENPDPSQKSVDQGRRSRENPKIPEKLTEEQKSSKGNPGSPEKLIERMSSKFDPGTHEKANVEQKPSHGKTNTSSLVLEKNSNTKKQETGKERKSSRQSTKTENKNSNKNDQDTKHDTRPKRKRSRSPKSSSQEHLSEEENVKKVLDNYGAEGTDHEGTQKPRAKLAKIEPPKSESNLEETQSPVIRKRGRPPKRTSSRCKVLKVEAKEVVMEAPEQVKRGEGAKKRKFEPEENKQILEKRSKVKCASCDFECDRQLFTDHNHKKHAGLSWVEGENPIDLNDEDAVSWNVKQAFKHIKSATCGKCGSVKKSALGFISHIQNCGKSEEEKAALKVNCPHCPARILKYSLPVHLKLYHFDSEGNKSSQEKVSVEELPMKRKSALRAVNKFCEVLSQEDDEEETKKKVQFVLYEKGKSKFPKLPGKTRNLWMKMIKEKKTIPCRRGSCLTESSSIQEARKHHFLCSELPPKSYVCERCDFFTESKNVIQQHVDIHPKMDRDYKLESEEEKSEDEADVKDAEDDESESFQKKPKTLVVIPSDDTALEASLKARFFAREGLLTVRQMRFCKQSLRMTLESEMEEVKKYSPVFPELRTQVSDWIHVKPENATDHFPSLNESISFRVNNVKKKSESDWKKMKRFQGEIIEDSAVIFTGGSILSMAWCKYSCLRLSKQDTKQYLAVSSSKKMDKFQNIHEERGDTPSLIQIYGCGEMKINNDIVEVPELAIGIVHEYGEVWDLAWFPLDAFEHSEDEQFLTRIGLLGAACQDGTIKIWPICDPDELKPKHSLPLYKIHPKAILELEDKADVGCLRLAIGRTGTVVGGYAGGLVAVWNLKTISSPFSKTDGKSSILKPIVSFQAHKTSITALSMCQNSDRYICTSGLDRFIKFWDLESPGNPFESLQKEVCLDNVWPKHWPLTISTLEDILPSCGKGMIKAVRELYCDKHRSPLALEGTCWSLSFNEWLNVLCGCNNIGEVKIRFLRNLFLTDETFRHRTGQVVCHTELKFLKDLGHEKVEENVESCKGKSKKNEKKAKQAKQAEENTAVPRTYEEAWKYFGLIFHDPVIEEESKPKSNVSKTSKKANQCLEDYPITSVNKVCWNPNYKRFMHLAIGHYCGLIRIKPVNDTKCDEDVLRFLAESEDEIRKSGLD